MTGGEVVITYKRKHHHIKSSPRGGHVANPLDKQEHSDRKHTTFHESIEHQMGECRKESSENHPVAEGSLNKVKEEEEREAQESVSGSREETKVAASSSPPLITFTRRSKKRNRFGVVPPASEKSLSQLPPPQPVVMSIRHSNHLPYITEQASEESPVATADTEKGGCNTSTVPGPSACHGGSSDSVGQDGSPKSHITLEVKQEAVDRQELPHTAVPQAPNGRPSPNTFDFMRATAREHRPPPVPVFSPRIPSFQAVGAPSSFAFPLPPHTLDEHVRFKRYDVMPAFPLPLSARYDASTSFVRHRMILDSIINRARMMQPPPPQGYTGLLDRSAWSEEELDHLWIGVRRHGNGNWRAFLADPKLRFAPWRAPKDLCDRWREEQMKLIYGNSFLASAIGSSPPRRERRPVAPVRTGAAPVMDTHLSLGDIYRRGFRAERRPADPPPAATSASQTLPHWLRAAATAAVVSTPEFGLSFSCRESDGAVKGMMRRCGLWREDEAHKTVRAENPKNGVSDTSSEETLSDDHRRL